MARIGLIFASLVLQEVQDNLVEFGGSRLRRKMADAWHQDQFCIRYGLRKLLDVIDTDKLLLFAIEDQGWRFDACQISRREVRFR